MAKRIMNFRVILNGQDISSDCKDAFISIVPGEDQTIAVNMYLNDITKDDDGRYVLWVGSQETVIE